MTQRNATNYKTAKRATHLGMMWRPGALSAMNATANTLSGWFVDAAAASAGARFAAEVATADDESDLEGTSGGSY